jgi:acyl carrier protein
MSDEISKRLTTCFQTVFPDIPESDIPSVSQATTPSWDSIAAITLVNVIEDEFQVQIDLDKLVDLDSFQKVLDYMRTALQPA